VSQDICDEVNDPDLGYLYPLHDDTCLAKGCYLARWRGGSNMNKCVSCVPDQAYAADKDYINYPTLDYPSLACCSNNYIPINDIGGWLITVNGIQCLNKDDEHGNNPGGEISAVTCNTAERGFAKIVQSVFPKLDCKTAYYIAIFGAGFITLIALAMIL
jgi:hypothetical protein